MRNTEMSNRTRTDIIAAILNTAQGGEVKTKIQAQCYLSYDQLIRYLKELTAMEMIEEKANRYHTTQKGLHTLQQLRSVQELISPTPIAA